MTTRADALRRAAALLRLAHSSNANEAALAAQRAQEILDRYELDRSVLELEGAQPAEPEEEIIDFGRRNAPLDMGAGTKRRERWTIALAQAIVHPNGCYLYMSGVALQLVGRPSDVDKCRYLYGWLLMEVCRLAERDGRGCGYTWRNNYRLGVVDTIREALREAAKRAANAMIAEVDAYPQVPRERALVLVQQALTRREERLADVVRWVRAHKRLYTTKWSASADPAARQAGREAGKTIRIGGARGSLPSGRP